MPSKSSKSSSKSTSSATGSTGTGPPALAALKKHRQQQRNHGKKNSSTGTSRLGTYWISIVAVSAVSIWMALNRNYDSNTISQAEQLGELSEQAVMDLWRQSCTRGAVTLVDRVPLDEMTPQRFHRDYLLPRRPVVIQGAYASSPLTAKSTAKDDDLKDETDSTSTSSSDKWSFEAIRQAYGHVHLQPLIPLRRGRNTQCTSTGLCKGPSMTLRELFDETFMLPMKERLRRKQINQQSTGTEPYVNPYPHDMNLEQTLPGLHNDYQKLSLLTENLHLATRQQNVDKWPSLFLGPATTKTGLHVDNHGTSFTMAVFRGIKQFVLFDAADGTQHLCLDQKLPGGSNYGMDAFSPNFRHCPSASQSHPQFASLRAGDLLYVPGSTHHAARNMDDSIGIAQNFLTIADYNSVVESLMGQAAQSLRILRKKPPLPPVEHSLLAQLDLFSILEETGYHDKYYSIGQDGRDSGDGGDDDDMPPVFVSVADSVRLATDRVVNHLQAALDQDASLATRVAFLSSNPYAILSLKAAGVWNCLDSHKRQELFVLSSSSSPQQKEADNDVYNLIRQAAATATTTTGASSSSHAAANKDEECSTMVRQYLGTLERNLQEATLAFEKEKGLV